jgi:hypothetical protein
MPLKRLELVVMENMGERVAVLKRFKRFDQMAELFIAEVGIISIGIMSYNVIFI